MGNKDKNAFDNTIDIPGKTTKRKYLEKNQQRELYAHNKSTSQKIKTLYNCFPWSKMTLHPKGFLVDNEDL